ncbi:type I-E CRISPR-associated protein Cse1/CasA [Flaviflexus equikiangi]|uniref:type I-E CRISPR-associated protein Cse1/CasA n=1 Tax=Flaviflexus equikiangi TaxID=2758573 RepID=UPI0015F3D389|nr:type I-E CRISPR-associated protein Cse1/CasA [Flaviflexus equikiangi]
MMTQQRASFDLLTEQWIKVRRTDGESESVGLYQLFDNFDDYLDLDGESQTQNFAVFRMIQAIFIRAIREEDDLDVTFDLPERWLYCKTVDVADVTRRYLERYEDRFDLFHPATPFYQVADLRTSKDEFRDASLLVPDVGPRLFSTSTQETSNQLDPAVAARWLIRLHAYDHSGIKSGAVGDPRVKNGKGYGIGTGWAGAIGAVQIAGKTLKETVLLNVPMVDLIVGTEERERDLAPWERTPDTSAPRSLEALIPNGLVDLLTWQQRRVRLVVDEELETVSKVVISNGDKIQVSNMFLDPGTGYRYSKAQSKNGIEVHFPRKHDAELTVWRGIQGIFQESSGPIEQGRKAPILDSMENDATEEFLREFQSNTVGLRLIGAVYGTQDAILTEEIFDEIPVSMSLLTRDGGEMRSVAVQAVERVMSFRGSMKWFLKQLLICGGASPEDEPEGPIHAWLNALENEFIQWVSALTPELGAEEASKRWRTIMRRVTVKHIASAVESAGPNAAVGWMETNENGNSVLHSSARYEAWIMRKLNEVTGVPKRTGDASPAMATSSTTKIQGAES